VVLVEHVLHEAGHKRPKDSAGMHSLIARSAYEVARPTLFAMAIIVAALIPVFTLQRVEGRIFRPLSLTYCFALVGALISALTVVPALCAVVMRPKDGDIQEPSLLQRGRAAYETLVRRLFPRWPVVLAGAAVLAMAAGLAGSRLGSEFLPELDEGDLVVFVEMPPSIGLDTGTDVLREVRRRMLAFPEVLEVMSEQGRPEDGTDDQNVNMSETFVHMAPVSTWRAGWTKDRLVEAIRASVTEIPGVDYNFSQPIKDNVEEAVSGVRGKVVLKIFGTDLDVMKATLERCVNALKTVPGIVDLGLYRDASIPQLQLVLDRPALARAGIEVSTAEDVVQTALGGNVATEYWQNERPVPVRVLFPRREREDEEGIANLLVPTGEKARVPLREVANVVKAVGRADINREDNSRMLAAKFNIEGRDMGSVVKDAMAKVNQDVKVPPGNFLTWGGEFENQQRALARLAVIVPISFCVVFALLYTALDSVRSATAVLVTAPFAMTGGVFALWATGIPLSVSGAVGFIALLGQVCLASLLVVSAVDERRRNGEDLVAALSGGAASRFRAVLLTGMLAILGLMPMALSSGVGSETERPFAVVIIGGLMTAIVVTLLVLPAFYRVIAGGAAPTGAPAASPGVG